MGFSVSKAKILVIDNVTKLDRSKFVKQFKIIGALSSARIVLITSIIFWDTPIMFVVELPKKNKQKCCLKNSKKQTRKTSTTTFCPAIVLLAKR